MHVIFNFTYNITLENLVPYEKENKIKKKIFKQINLLQNYYSELQKYKINSSISTTILNSQLGVLLIIDKDYTEAINKFLICKEFYETFSNHFVEQLYFLGKCYYKLEDYDSFIELFEKSTTMYLKNNIIIIDIANMYGIIGNYYDKFNKIKVLEYYTKQLDIAKQIYTEENNYIADIYRRIGN